MGFGTDRLQLCLLLRVGPWASCLDSLGSRLLTCEVGISEPISQDRKYSEVVQRLCGQTASAQVVRSRT